MKLKTCLECMKAKVCWERRQIRCVRPDWVFDLSPAEVKKKDIYWRSTFKRAQHCKEFEDADG